MFPEAWTHEQILRQGLAEILINQHHILANQEKHMSKLTDLQASVNKLQADTTAFIAANTGGATDADLDALKTQVDAIDAVINPPAPTA